MDFYDMSLSLQNETLIWGTTHKNIQSVNMYVYTERLEYMLKNIIFCSAPTPPVWH